jgi:hypothetical protein
MVKKGYPYINHVLNMQNVETGLVPVRPHDEAYNACAAGHAFLQNLFPTRIQTQHCGRSSHATYNLIPASHHSAVHGQNHASDPGSPFASKEQNGFNDIVGLSIATRWVESVKTR